MADRDLVAPSRELADRRHLLGERLASGTGLIHGRTNVRYLTGYDGGGFAPWLILRDGSVSLVHYTAEEDSVATLAAEMELISFGPGDDEVATVSRALDARPGARVLGDLPWWSADELRGIESSTGIPIDDCSEAIGALRAVKSEWEQRCLRAAGAITAATMDRLVAMAADGATGRELAIALHESAIAAGSGPLPPVPYVAVGQATYENHTTWDASDERAGPYLIEFATSVAGYGVPLSRSATESDRGQEALTGIRQGIEAALAIVRAGVEAREADACVRSAIAAAGFELRHRAGYSIGLAEPDTWMEGRIARLAPLSTYRLKAGMAFHIVGSVVVPGEFGVAHSVSVLVTRDGAEVLAG